MVSGVDYTNRNTDLDRGMVHLNPQYSNGFPLPEGMLPSTGTLGVAFLAIDFTDSPGSDNQLTEIQRVATELNEYWAFQSGGKFQMDFRFGDRVFHVPKDSAIYGLQSSPAPTRELTADVLQIADPFVDFTGVQSVFMLIPEGNTNIAQDWHKPPFPGRKNAGGPFGEGSILTDEGRVLAWSGNGFFFERADVKQRGGVTMFYVHETLHDMGITDLYLWTGWIPGQIFKPTTEWPMGDWDVMQNQNGEAREVIAWHRWLLGWLDDEQVYCIPLESLIDLELSLSPLTRTASGYKAAVIPVSERKVIVVESRRAEGYSATAGNMPIAVDEDGIRRRAWLKDFGAEGLLVYTYDTSLFWGEAPARMQIPEGRPNQPPMLAMCPITVCTWADPDDPWQNYEAGQDSVAVPALFDPLVRLGQSITVEGVTIELIESGDADRVRISK